MVHKNPNILILGTPGVGKSTLCAKVVKRFDIQWINVSKFAEERNCIIDYDNELQSMIIDERKVVRELKPLMKQGGYMIEYHGCDFFPKHWFDYVVVLTTDTSILYNRLKERGYNARKLKNNIECEIFNEIHEEAVEHFGDVFLYKKENNNQRDMKRNVKFVVSMLNEWSILKNS